MHERQRRKKSSYSAHPSIHERFKRLAEKHQRSLGRELEYLLSLGEAVEGLEESKQNVIERFLERIENEQVTTETASQGD